jgi:NAD(P)-dependent dehydrogenase (short-subunit alcohol dehydrogenase family)
VSQTSPIQALTLGSARFRGKTVLVAGGAGGMGRAAVRKFVQEGARVAVLDIRRDNLDTLADEVHDELGGSLITLQADLSQASETDRAIAEVAEQLDSIDVLFNHAGTILVKPFHETTEVEFDHLLAVNLKSAFLVCRRVVPSMVRSGGGSIVITGSIASEKAFALESVYSITKAGVLMLARCIAAEYRSQNIRANAICPAFVRTDHGIREIEQFAALGQVWDEAALARAQGRICEPDEIADAVLFLASDAAAFINGSALYLDNGWHAVA